MPRAQSLTIGALAAAGGVGVETIRYYQRRGLIAVPPRDHGGAGGSIRRYGAPDVTRLRFIRGAQRAGFTLDQIAELLALDADEDRTRVRRLALDRLAVLDAEIAALAHTRASLAALATACGSGGAGPCPILTAFEAGDPDGPAGQDA